MSWEYAPGTVLPERRALDHYPTSDVTVQQAFRGLLNLEPMLDYRATWKRPLRILDPGAGEGNWGHWPRAQWPDCELTGVDIRDVGQPGDLYSHWYPNQSFQTWENKRGVGFDLIIGNPPYSDAEAFVRHGLDMLLPGGWLMFLLPLAFRAGQKRRDGLYAQFPLRCLGVCSKRPSFSGDNKTNKKEFAVFYWQLGWKGETTDILLK